MKKEKQDNRYKSLNNAVSIPSAQNDTLCDPSNQLGAVASALMERVESLKVHNLDMHIFAKTMLLGGLRVSEMLAIRAGDIDNLGRVVIRGLKGGVPRICDTGMNASQFIVWREHNYVPWRTWNRFFVYREFKKYGIQLDVEGGEKKSVTHALRHASAQIAATIDPDLSATQSLLGHKSKSNTEIYAKQKSAKVLNREGKPSAGASTKANHKRPKK